MKAIINTNIVMSDHMIADGAIVMDGDKIVDIGKNIKVGSAECIDARGLFTGPGLIDIHTHAGDNQFFFENPVAASRFLLENGVTDVLPTLYFAMNSKQLIESAKTIQAAKDSGEAPNILGFYMEAPYMNPKFGCDRENNPWKNDIRREDYTELLDAIGDKVKVVSGIFEGYFGIIQEISEDKKSLTILASTERRDISIMVETKDVKVSE